MLGCRLQVIIKDGVLVKVAEIKAGDDSQHNIDYIVTDGAIKIEIAALISNQYMLPSNQ